MESNETTIRHGIHNPRPVRNFPKMGSRVDGTKDFAIREVQNTINRLTKKGDARFAGVWNTGCLFISRKGGQYRVSLHNHRPNTGVR